MKVVEAEQITYAVILAVLLGLRLWWAIARRLAATPVPARRTASSPRLVGLRRHVQFRSFDRTAASWHEARPRKCRLKKR